MLGQSKFRGKLKDRYTYVYGAYLKHQVTTLSPIRSEVSIEDEENNYKHIIINSGFSDWGMPKPISCYEVEEHTVSQFSGLLDINNKEIYSGDKVEKLFEENKKFIGLVKFSNVKGKWVIEGNWYQRYSNEGDFEIIRGEVSRELSLYYGGLSTLLIT